MNLNLYASEKLFWIWFFDLSALNKCAIPISEMLNNSKRSNIIPMMILANEFFNLRFVFCTNHVNAGTCESLKLEHVCCAIIWMKRERDALKTIVLNGWRFRNFIRLESASVYGKCAARLIMCSYARTLKKCNIFQSFCDERIVIYSSTQLKFSANVYTKIRTQTKF